MNKQIKEIIEKTVKTTFLEFSTEYVTVSIESEELGVKTVQRIPIEFCERFAELIVKECLDIVNRKEYSYHEADPLWETAQLIKQHFGVEYEQL
jgi:hypothetical protein